MSVAVSLPEDLKAAMVASGTWRETSPVPLSRLALVSVPYVDFQGKLHDDGRIVTLDVVAEHVAAIFSDLCRNKFPIEKVRSIDHYGGDDELSMADNNSSCYCCRPIMGSAVLSLHAYGAAVDINPMQNPYIVFDENHGNASFHPKASWQFANRSNYEVGMVEPIVDIFASHGFFVWGGRWKTPIDYHHFQIPRGLAEILAVVDPAHGKRIFDALVSDQRRNLAVPTGEKLQPLIELYRKDTAEFFTAWSNLVTRS